VTWLRQNGDKLAQYVLASAVVAPTAFHRGVLVATFWFVKPKTPLEVFGHRSDAVKWAVAQGQRAGLSGLEK